MPEFGYCAPTDASEWQSPLTEPWKKSQNLRQTAAVSQSEKYYMESVKNNFHKWSMRYCD